MLLSQGLTIERVGVTDVESVRIPTSASRLELSEL